LCLNTQNLWFSDQTYLSDACETWMLKTLLVFKKRILRKTIGPIKELSVQWRIKINKEIYRIFRN
jgi:hypothetical protein